MAAGFFGFFLEDINVRQADKFFPEFEGIFDEIESDRYYLGRKVLPKLNRDRFLQENNEVIIGFEGVNLTPDITNFQDFFKAYRQTGLAFISQLKGVFSGFIYDKISQKIHIFTDHLATKSIYYYFDPKYGFAFSSSLQVLSKAFRKHQIPYHLEKDAVYMMALYGLVLEDFTYIQEVKRLPYGSVLTYDLKEKKLTVDSYFKYVKTKNNYSYQESIDQIENLLTGSINANWEKDHQYSNTHFSFLSGGMDARVNAMIAKELGFDNIHTLTFGQSGSKDIEYARMIASGEGFKHFENHSAEVASKSPNGLIVCFAIPPFPFIVPL